MRNRFSSAIVATGADEPSTVFLTGDLGYKALEPVREALGDRFINVGVAEQQMVSIAAGLARSGLRPWAYSIAPFIYARPFEQIRNDVCLHHLPVRLVGNGGGYGYGVMGATHHALEDYGTLLTLGGMTVMVPAFGDDVAEVVARASAHPGPVYLRLGLAEEGDAVVPGFAPWRRVLDGQGATILVCGPLAGMLLRRMRDLPLAQRPRLWVVAELPFGGLPEAFLDDVRASGRLIVAEEHVAHGGVGQMVATALLTAGVMPRSFAHRHALGYPSGRYGSQSWHRAECGLDVASMLALLDDDGSSPAHRPCPTPRERGGIFPRTIYWRRRRTMTAWDADAEIARLQGPILILGASGFIGANLMNRIRAVRKDVTGTARRLPAWRLDGVPPEQVRVTDLLIEANLDAVLSAVRPRTVLNCLAYGAYSFEGESDRIYETNLTLTQRLVTKLASAPQGIVAYVHAGSSSEYGTNAAGTPEDGFLAPNSDYAVSKASAAHFLHYHGRHRGFPGINLRLYSVYGPMEDSSRLIPTLMRAGLSRRYPPLVNPDISRDFIHVDDVCEAFVRAALSMRPEVHGTSVNIGSGVKTTIRDLASVAQGMFGLEASPEFVLAPRAWDVTDWFANVSRARDLIGWAPRTALADGLASTRQWFAFLPDPDAYERSSKRFGLDTRHSVTAVIACYRDAQAIPIMHARLRDTFAKLNIDYEIIFVNDCSPDDSEAVIQGISRDDHRVIGISHSRNFGSQAAFRSGMEIATKNACVLLDGDLQDPPEIIVEFVAKWREGYDVVFGRRVKREAPWYMQVAYKAFYRVFDAFSYLTIPHDAGDFALMDRRVMVAVLDFPERDLFLRGIRAFAGFRQTGVDYVRPERMFGRSTNNLLRNIGWAKRGILSFSETPLNVLLFVATILFGLTMVVAVAQALFRLFFPDWVAPGITTVILTILFFGSLNLFAVALLGEYIGRIFTEVKARPRYIRRAIVTRGEVRPAGDLMR